MMKKELCYLCCLALLFSCERNAVPDSERGELVPLSVQELTLSEEAAVSRVSPGMVTTDGAAISVSQLAFNGYMPAYNCVYTYSAADGWTAADPLFVDARQAKIAGVYDPENVGAFPASNTSTVSSTKLTAQVYDDTKVWYFDNSHTGVTCFASSVAFKMQPVYSRITLQIERDASYLDACTITEVTLSSGGVFFNELPFDVATGTLQGSATAYNATTTPLLKNDAGFVTIPSGIKNIDLMLPPQTIQGTSLLLSIKVDGLVRSVTIPYASLPKLVSGTQYNVPLLIVGPATLILNGNVTDGGWSTTSTNIGSITNSSGMN